MSFLKLFKQSIRESPAKVLLLTAIAATSAAPVLFVTYPEPEFRLVIYKLLAKCGSLAGTVLLAWQLLLGFRGAVPWLMTDLIWVIELHKKLGVLAAVLILFHPVFISLYYLDTYGFVPLVWQFDADFDTWVMLGQIALVVLLVVALTSVWFRSRLTFSTWRLIHLTSYLILPLVIVHSLPIGQTLGTSPLRLGWYALIAAFALFYIYRALVRAGLFTRPYEVVRADPVAENVVEIQMKPLKKQLKPFIAQFIYFRRTSLSSVHPYTVSRYDTNTGLLAITVKALGDASTQMQKVQIGERVRLDGPYGIFTREAHETGRPLVMMAGGIGITPFIRLVEKIEKDHHREAYLFYANRFRKDIAYKQELDSLKHVKVVHVLSDEPVYEGEKGFATLDLVKKYLDHPVLECEYLICGPTPMIVMLEENLLDAGLPPAQIHHELFAY